MHPNYTIKRYSCLHHSPLDPLLLRMRCLSCWPLHELGFSLQETEQLLNPTWSSSTQRIGNWISSWWDDLNGVRTKKQKIGMNWRLEGWDKTGYGQEAGRWNGTSVDWKWCDDQLLAISAIWLISCLLLIPFKHIIFTGLMEEKKNLHINVPSSGQPSWKSISSRSNWKPRCVIGPRVYEDSLQRLTLSKKKKKWTTSPKLSMNPLRSDLPSA